MAAAAVATTVVGGLPMATRRSNFRDGVSQATCGGGGGRSSRDADGGNSGGGKYRRYQSGRADPADIPYSSE